MYSNLRAHTILNKTVMCSFCSTFVDRYLDDMNDKQLRMYDFIINKPGSDWDIYYWMIGKFISSAVTINNIYTSDKKGIAISHNYSLLQYN